MPRVRPTRQPATLHDRLHESNPNWDRDDDEKWRCRINPCSRSFARKGGLVHHRKEAHNLSKYQANIPDQRKSKDAIEAIQRTGGLFTEPTDRTRKCSKADIIRELKSNGARFVRNYRSEFDDFSPDEIQRMLSYGLENGCFDDYPSLGIELLALILSKERQINQNAGAGPAQLEDSSIMGSLNGTEDPFKRLTRSGEEMGSMGSPS